MHLGAAGKVADLAQAQLVYEAQTAYLALRVTELAPRGRYRPPVLGDVESVVLSSQRVAKCVFLHAAAGAPSDAAR